MQMPGSNTLTVAQREFLARIRTKGFWISTIALPLFVIAMGVVPSLLMLRSGKTHRLVVVDETGRVRAAIRDDLGRKEEAREGAKEKPADFEVELLSPSSVNREELNRRVLADEIDSWIWIDEAALEKDEVEYHAESVSNFLTQARLEDALSSAVRADRLRAAGYDAEEVGRLARRVDLSAVKVTEEGEKKEGVEAGIILAYLLFFMLYMVLVIYGQQVMNGVLEEKSSRIVEVMASTTRPFELMMGKLLGICCTALAQLAIWLTTVVVVTLPGVVSAIAWIPEDASIPTIGPSLLVHFLINFLLGFFLFSSFYAAIGAAFNSLQEAQQFASIAVIFLVAPILFFWKVLNDPDGTLAVVSSMIPLFTPLLMMLRIAIKAPPAWQIGTAYLLTAGAIWVMVWISSRIYRVGILMYGKKPTLRELWRWVRYA